MTTTKPAVLVLCLFSTTAGVGCVEREPYNAYDLAAAQQFHAEQRAQATKAAPIDAATAAKEAAKVRCRCDAEGGLHVTAPADAQVTAVTADGREDAEAEIAMPERRPGTPIRQTVSLGYVGDGPLTQVPSRGGPWNVPDALLPPHQHVEPRYPSVITYGAPFYGYGYGYGSRFYGGYAGRGAAPSRGAAGGGVQAPSGHNLSGTTHYRTTGISYGAHPGSSGGARGGGLR